MSQKGKSNYKLGIDRYQQYYSQNGLKKKYITIYTLKLEDIAPNLYMKIIPCWNDKLGRMYNPQKNRDVIGKNTKTH